MPPQTMRIGSGEWGIYGEIVRDGMQIYLVNISG
jgi:hypothetical protein